MVLNTSFNLRGEPIVCTPTDAVRTFFSSGMDVLVMGVLWWRSERAWFRSFGSACAEFC